MKKLITIVLLCVTVSPDWATDGNYLLEMRSAKEGDKNYFQMMAFALDTYIRSKTIFFRI